MITKTKTPYGLPYGVLNSSLGNTAGFGTLHMQVAGLHRACPSVALDK